MVWASGWVCEEGQWWLFFCIAAYFKSLSVMWRWREMSQSLWVHTEPLCPWSLTGKQRASCGPAHFILSSGLLLFQSVAGLSVWLSLPLLVGRDLKLSLFVGVLSSKIGQQEVTQCKEMIWKTGLTEGRI